MTGAIRIASNNLFLKDAIGNFCYDLANVYRKHGFDAQLYSFSYDQNGLVSNYETLFSDMKENDLLFYHHSIDDPFLPKISELPGKKIFYFHGITPPELLIQYQPITAGDCEKGLQQITDYLKYFDFLCANSHESTKQLIQYKNSDMKINRALIIPPLVASRDSLHHVQRKKAINHNKKTLLSVGRIVPHKKIEDTIKIVSAFTLLFPEVDIELQVVGTFPETDYKKYIFSLIEELQLTDKIVFKGFVPDEELKVIYEAGDAYILMSAHEGFGVPLVEAMQASIPILAYYHHGVKQVLQESGCQITEKNPEKSAQLLHKLLFDQQYQEAIIGGQNKQLEHVLDSCDESVFLNLIKKLGRV